MNNLYFISDTHFYHANVIKYSDRPFKDLDDMHETMIRDWNEIVEDGDIVVHLGDFGFGSKEQMKAIVDRLNGDIVLIKGNHDRHGQQWHYDAGFVYVEKDIIEINHVLMSHRPIVDIVYGETNIHGHIHNNLVNMEAIAKENDGCYINACVEVNNYRPFECPIVTFKQIKQYISQ